MARKKDRDKAITLRHAGYSYSQIKTELGIAKSTLSGWLKDMPLSSERLYELQRNEVVIEKIRETKRSKKAARRAHVYSQVSRDIENSDDPEFIAGFYLYWGEGTKTAEYSTSLTNSDPALVHCFIGWLEKLGVCREDMKVKLHLYADQSEQAEKRFWSTLTRIPLNNFNKTYWKSTYAHRKTYKGMFAHGTCVVTYSNRDMYEYVLAGVQYLRDKYTL